MAEVTVVIPNYNGIGYLKDCLDTLKVQSFQDFSALVVDNGSEDGSAEFVRAYYPWVKVLELEENYGFCRAVNEGIKASQTPYVFLLNNDTKLHRKCIEELLAVMRRRPLCFSCQARMVKMYEPELLDDGGDYYCALGWAYARGKDRPWKNDRHERRIFAACAGAAMYRMSVFERIGLFDEVQFAYLEDMDVGYRARIFGYENRYAPGAIVWHVGSGTSGSRYNEFKVRCSARNNLYLIYKNMPLPQIVLNMPLLLTGFVLKWIFFLRKGLGNAYVRGLLSGVGLCVNGRKVNYQKKHFRNYVRIQAELWINTVRRFLPAR